MESKVSRGLGGTCSLNRGKKKTDPGEGGKRGIKRESFRERDSTFSLNFPTIRPAVSGGARGRVHPHGKGFTYKPEFRSFNKLQEVGLLLLWLLSTLSVVWWLCCPTMNVWLYFAP